MPSTMQPVFPLSQEPPTQLVILPTEPPTHGTPHTLGEAGGCGGVTAGHPCFVLGGGLGVMLGVQG